MAPKRHLANPPSSAGLPVPPGSRDFLETPPEDYHQLNWLGKPGIESSALLHEFRFGCAGLKQEGILRFYRDTVSKQGWSLFSQHSMRERHGPGATEVRATGEVEQWYRRSAKGQKRTLTVTVGPADARGTCPVELLELVELPEVTGPKRTSR
jgi:hypothetical protein